MSRAVSHYLLVTVSGSKVKVEAYDVNDKLVDSVERSS